MRTPAVPTLPGRPSTVSLRRHAQRLLASAVAGCFAVGPATAQPVAPTVIHGTATLAQQGTRTTITTGNGAGTAHSAIDWQSFGVPRGHSVFFSQPNAASTSINRVTGPDPSALFGTLGSNGRLVLVNPAGITVGAGAVVDTAGFAASTLRMTDADALAGRLRFGDGTHSGPLRVDGRVVARGGDVVLIAPSVETASRAVVASIGGDTVLAAGRKVEVTGRGLEGIRMEIQAPTDRAVNLGTLRGDSVAIFASQLHHSGLVQATAATLAGGKVVLRAQQAEIGGTVTARAGDGGGSVHVSTAGLVLKAAARIDTRSPRGRGGHVSVEADRAVVEPGAVLRAETVIWTGARDAAIDLLIERARAAAPGRPKRSGKDDDDDRRDDDRGDDDRGDDDRDDDDRDDRDDRGAGNGGGSGRGGNSGSGGNPASGGNSGSGSSSGQGGNSGAGGSPGPGGNSGSGGNPGSSGASGSGGSPGNGSPGSGGHPGPGGDPPGSGSGAGSGAGSGGHSTNGSGNAGQGTRPGPNPAIGGSPLGSGANQSVAGDVAPAPGRSGGTASVSPGNANGGNAGGSGHANGVNGKGHPGNGNGPANGNGNAHPNGTPPSGNSGDVRPDASGGTGTGTGNANANANANGNANGIAGHGNASGNAGNAAGSSNANAGNSGGHANAASATAAAAAPSAIDSPAPVAIQAPGPVASSVAGRTGPMSTSSVSLFTVVSGAAPMLRADVQSAVQASSADLTQFFAAAAWMQPQASPEPGDDQRAKRTAKRATVAPQWCGPGTH